MKRLKAILSKVLEVSEESITEETSPQNVENWDSFNALLIVSELESAFGVSFTMDEISSVKNVKDIIASLKRYGVQLDEERP